MNKTSICNILRQNNLINSTKKNQSMKKPINNTTYIDKKVSQKKLINIHKIKYNDSKNNTHMNKKEFYSSHYRKGNIENFYLSNGCNKTLSKGGGGTNSAITEISTEFFNKQKIKLIYDNNLDFNRIYSNQRQIMNFDGKILNAGSVLFSSYEHNFFNYNIRGVYHINGVDWNVNNIKSYEDNNENTNIVKEYYIQTINHFIRNSLDNSLLFLAQIPGRIFNGDTGTINGINSAIEEIKKDEYLTHKNLTIVFDLI